MTAKDIEDADCDDEEEKPTPKKKKSLTEEDLPEIVNQVVKALRDTVSAPEPVKEPEVQKKSTLDIAADGLYNSVSSAINMQGATLEQRLESINPALQELGNTISAMVRDSMGQLAPAPTVSDNAVVLDAVTNLAETVKSLATEVATLKAGNTQVASPNRIPVPRSIQPQLVAQSLTKQPEVKPGSITDIVRRSVGIK